MDNLNLQTSSNDIPAEVIPKKTSHGPILLVILLLTIFGFGGIYLTKRQINQPSVIITNGN